MFREEYGEAAVEVLDILDNTNKEDVAKIPPSFIQFLVDNASDDYVVNLDHSKPINELNIKEKTKEILGTIYINWWCDNKQKEQYKKQIEEQERKEQEELREKYDPDKMFKNRENMQTSNEIQKMQEDIEAKDKYLVVVNQKENIFKKIINKIKSFFKKW